MNPSFTSIPETWSVGPFEKGAIFTYPGLLRRTGLHPEGHLSDFELFATIPAASNPQTQQVEASTYGWDTAFAIRLPDVNSAITKNAASPKLFRYELPDKTCSLSGTFNTWQITPGGDEDLVHFKIGIPTATCSQKNPDGSDKPIDVKNLTVIVELRLHILEHLPDGTTPAEATNPTAPATPKPASTGKLMVRCTPVSDKEPAANIHSLVPDPKTPIDFVTKAIIQGCLLNWFNDHLADFKHVFSSVDLNQMVDRGGFQWLAPTDTSYAYVDGKTEDDCYLGVLCMTRGRPAGGLINQVSTVAIPTGQRASFLIDRARIMEEIILPKLPLSFPGATVSDFSLSTDKTVITLVNQVAMKPVDHDGKTFHPYVESMEVTLVGAEIIITSQAKVELSAGITGHVKNTTFLGITLVNRPDGKQTLAFSPTRPAVSGDPWTTQSTGIEIVKWIIAALAVIASIALSFFTAGTSLLVGCVVIGLIAGLAAEMPTIVALIMKGQVTNDCPAIDELVLNSTSPIVWTGTKQFQLKAAQLNGSLQLSGDPKFAH